MKSLENVKLIRQGFYIELATKYGIMESILLDLIFYWVNYNEEHCIMSHYKNGRFWFYATNKWFETQLPFTTYRTISRKLHRLEDLDLIKLSNYNKLGYDRTQWITLTDTGLYEMQNIHFKYMEQKTKK